MHTPLHQPWYATLKKYIKQAVSLQSLLQGCGGIQSLEKSSSPPPLEPKAAGNFTGPAEGCMGICFTPLACGSILDKAPAPFHHSPVSLATNGRVFQPRGLSGGPRESRTEAAVAHVGTVGHCLAAPPPSGLLSIPSLSLSLSLLVLLSLPLISLLLHPPPLAPLLKGPSQERGVPLAREQQLRPHIHSHVPHLPQLPVLCCLPQCRVCGLLLPG